MKTSAVCYAGLVVWLCASCQATSDNYGQATKARLDPDQLREVQTIIARAVDQPTMRISSDAFAGTHILVLEPALRRTPEGTLAQGTTTTRPHTFHLLTSETQCVIQDLATGIRHPVSFNCERSRSEP